MKRFFKKYKTQIAGVATAVMALVTVKGWVDTATGTCITACLAACGIAMSKDQSDHSNTEQVRKADRGL